MNNLFKGLIYCSCGKKFNYKNDNGSYIYVCSRYKNQGKLACPRNIIKELDLLHIIQMHCPQELINDSIDVKKLISKIEVNGDSITIFYKDNSISAWNNDKLTI